MVEDTDHPPQMLKTKIVHAGLAVTAMTRVAASLVMRRDESGETGNLCFEIHEYRGLATFGLFLAFWIAGLISDSLGTLWASLVSLGE
jgi:hypothetical protein